MAEEGSADEPRSTYPCPKCGSPVPIGEQRGPVQCAKCGEQFLPAVELDYESAPLSPPTVAPSSEQADDSELSELRIRNISNLRRGAYRSRSWLIIAAGICVVGAAKSVQLTVVGMRGHLYWAAIGDALFTLAALILASFTIQKIIALTREIRSSRLQDPVEPPDLSNLSDGSQRWKDLENMTNQKE